jgi:hypothetical protein
MSAQLSAAVGADAAPPQLPRSRLLVGPAAHDVCAACGPEPSRHEHVAGCRQGCRRWNCLRRREDEEASIDHRMAWASVDVFSQAAVRCPPRAAIARPIHSGGAVGDGAYEDGPAAGAWQVP